ncbi:hypothetical protein Taro_051429 [Colocasia esculenta]|uniref:Aminotransferase-like plant mobile domain-containing protein n=1 Tax=Colocasia esculenta TaxID=4460 RepID=A0A843XFX9_COLES|nr:hypothetical protein [Colocasia esculenta]
MEGEHGEGKGGDGSGRRRKKTIRRRQPSEGPSTTAPELPLVTPMEEEIAPAAGDDDEPVGPKKSELRSRHGWSVVRAFHDGLPDFQRRRLEGMGFGPFLRLEELVPDVALIQALKERWDLECHAFLFPWGHMMPTLEDVVQITGLRVDGQAVTGVTYTSYQEPVEKLLGLEVRGERSSLVQWTALQASLGVANARHRTGESQAEYMARLTEDARAVLAEEEGEAADRDLQRFLTLVIRKLILGTRGDPSGHLQPGDRCGQILPTSAGVGIPPPPLPGSRGGEATRRYTSPVALAVRWTPYVGENDATQPWVERGRPYFGRDIWLHCFNTVIPLHHRLVARTLGLHQAVVEFPTRQRPWERPGRSFRGIQQVTEWTVRVQEQLDDWEQRGKEVVSEAMSNEDYFRAYVQRYGAQLDPEGRISSLDDILHSTIQQRDDLQAVVDQLLDRAQQMVGGASSSREDPGRSVLEGQLLSAVARAEDALAQLREREQELRTALARTTTLEAEMVELRLRPEAAEVTQWRKAAEEASRWCQEAEAAARWQQDAEEAARLRTEAGDLRTQLGDERHRCDMLQFEMKGLERALALVGRSRSAASRSGIPSGSAGHYLTSSSRRRRNEEEARWQERALEGSETGPRAMAPPSLRPPEGTGENG